MTPGPIAGTILGMGTYTKAVGIDPQELADMEAVANTRGIVRDPELLARIRERAARVRDEALRKFGVQDIGVEILREIRCAG